MKVSVIIPVYGAYNRFKKLLKSIRKNFDFEHGEIIIVDDCFGDKFSQKLKKTVEKYPRIKLIKNETNLGYLKSCNYAIKHAGGDIVVLLNSDTEIPKNFCAKIIRCFESDRKIVAASPLSSASARYFIPQIFPLEKMNKFLDTKYLIYPDVSNSEGFCFCVRKSYTDKYGLFDTVYGAGYCEEVDFCYRLRTDGFRCVLIDNLYVKHKHHASFKKKRSFLIAQNNKILYSKWKNLINSMEKNWIITPINEIISERFGKFAPLIFFLKKLKNQFNSNRIFTIKNIFSCKKYTRRNSKKVVYTAISGEYDILPIVHDYVDKNWNYVCFTDNKTLLNLKSFGQWEIRPLACNEFDFTRNARYHKTHPHVLFQEYEESLWVDANVNILTPHIFETIKMKNVDMLVPAHYCRECVFEEVDIVLALKKDEPVIVEKMRDFLNKNNMPRHFGLNETNIFYRKHNSPKVIDLMNDWWFFIENYSKRDQLSFSYVLFKHGIQVSDISIDNARIDVLNYKIYTHNPTNTLTGKVLSRLLP